MRDEVDKLICLYTRMSNTYNKVYKNNNKRTFLGAKSKLEQRCIMYCTLPYI